MNLFFLTSFILLINSSHCAEIKNFESSRHQRQIRHRGNNKFQLPSYLSPDAYSQTLYSSDRRGPDGFNYEYETSNGIKVKQESSGYGADKVVRGYYSYIGSDGVPYTVNYIADRFGYRAYGAHLPTQPDEVYDQTKLPVYSQPIPSYRPTPVPPSVYPISSQYLQYPYSPQSSQNIYVSETSPSNYVNITPKPSHIPTSVQPLKNTASRYNKYNYLSSPELPPRFEWTTQHYNPIYSGPTTPRSYVNY